MSIASLDIAKVALVEAKHGSALSQRNSLDLPLALAFGFLPSELCMNCCPRSSRHGTYHGDSNCHIHLRAGFRLGRM